MLNLLVELQKEFELTYLFIAHDLRVVVMYLGKIMEFAGAKDLYRRPRHPYTQALLSAAPMPDPKKKKDRIILEGCPLSHHPADGLPLSPRCPYRQKDCETEIPEYREIEPSHMIACDYPIN